MDSPLALSPLPPLWYCLQILKFQNYLDLKGDYKISIQRKIYCSTKWYSTIFDSSLSPLPLSFFIQRQRGTSLFLFQAVETDIIIKYHFNKYILKLKLNTSLPVKIITCACRLSYLSIQWKNVLGAVHK